MLDTQSFQDFLVSLEHANPPRTVVEHGREVDAEDATNLNAAYRAAKQQPVRVAEVLGAESALRLADHLSEAFGLPHGEIGFHTVRGVSDLVAVSLPAEYRSLESAVQAAAAMWAMERRYWEGLR